MDAGTPRHETELSEFERRLAGWRPDSEGLDADAMLFAAGLAAGRRGGGRVLWAALCVVLAVQAVGLAAWGFRERAERVALASRLHEPSPAPQVPGLLAATELPEPTYTPSPEDYFHLRQRLEQDPNHWLASAAGAGTATIGPPPPQASILRAGQRDGPLP